MSEETRERDVTTVNFKSFDAWLKVHTAATAADILHGIDVGEGEYKLTFFGDEAKRLASVAHELNLPMRGYTHEYVSDEDIEG